MNEVFKTKNKKFIRDFIGQLSKPNTTYERQNTTGTIMKFLEDCEWENFRARGKFVCFGLVGNSFILNF